MTDPIEILDPTRWQGYPLDFSYASDSFYDVAIERTGVDFAVSFVKKAFAQPFFKTDEGCDKLYQPYWQGAVAYGVLKNDRLIAVIETCAEVWSNRLRVTELWIDAPFRRRGIAAALMNAAKEQAVREKRRAVILETQSCNANAIAFYLSQGFTLIGFDACCYSNRDIERREVRMEMGYFLP